MGQKWAKMNVSFSGLEDLKAKVEARADELGFNYSAYVRAALIKEIVAGGNLEIPPNPWMPAMKIIPRSKVPAASVSRRIPQGTHPPSESSGLTLNEKADMEEMEAERRPRKPRKRQPSP